MAPEEAIGQCLTRHRFRFLVLVIATLCLSSVFSNMITLNFTINCMDSKNGTRNASQLHYSLHDYTMKEKTTLQWAVSVAAMIATFPFSYICTRMGAKWAFLGSGLVSALTTALIPPAADWGFHWFLVMRFFQGLAYACDFSVIGVICTRWASLSDISMFLSMLTLFPAFSNIFTNALAGPICDSEYGWPWVHYSHGIISASLFVLWALFYTDRPEESRFVSTRELITIHEGKSEAHKRATGRPPYLRICKNPVVWAVWINAFTDLFAAFFFIIYNPTYYTKVLHYGHTNTGILGALDAIAIVPLKLVAGYASDAYNCVPERQKMWIYNSLCTLIPAAIFVVVSFMPTSIPIITVILFGVSNASVGFNGGGYYRCACLVTRQYADFVIAFTQFIKCAVFFLAPLLVQIFVHDEYNAGQWHIIFFIMAGSLVISNAVFCWYATAEPADFTEDNPDEGAVEEAEKRHPTLETARTPSLGSGGSLVDVHLSPRLFADKRF